MIRAIDPDLARDSLLATIRQARFSCGIVCPRCLSTRVRKWGSFSGRQRYHCRGCGRTFSDLTHTPAAYSKRLAHWDTYATALAYAVSVRRAAALAAIHPSTSFRWRHALLDELRVRTLETLRGWTEVTSICFAYSEKGRRDVMRAPARRGGRISRHQRGPAANVVIACDRRGNVVSAIGNIARSRALTTGVLETVLRDRIDGNVVLIARHGRFGPASLVARRRKGTFHDARVHERRVRSLIHVRNALAYIGCLEQWLLRFRGVATRYLPNYLAWHRVIDRVRRSGLEAAALSWAIDV